MRFSSAVFLVSFCLIQAPTARADVWETTGIWNDAAEVRYSDWIKNSFTERFFLEGDWAQIETDCADAVYGSRMIFSYLNGLPFSLSATEIKVTNSSKDFDSISNPVERVRAFLAYVNNRTWTGTLSKHTYPVAITRETIVPGVIWLKPGHVETVRKIRDGGAVELRGSWLPAAIRQMITVTQLGNVPRKPVHGFRRWIWPQNLLKPLSAQPGFDNLQQTMIAPASVGETLDEASGETVLKKPSALETYYDVSKFESAVQAALAVAPETRVERADRLSSDFCALVKSRSQVVRAGYGFSQAARRCMNEKEYYAYSTPSRDSNLRRVVIGLGLEFGNNLNEVRQLLDRCEPVAISDTESVKPYEFFRHLLMLDYSSNPHETPAARFGLAPVERVCVSPDDDEP
ncbi:hypothetical protein BH10BDE1_BH10BDE1_15650 [soil metagenome]